MDFIVLGSTALGLGRENGGLKAFQNICEVPKQTKCVI